MTHVQPTGDDRPVLIVGAGPTGLTLACELARRGIPFRLVEVATRPQPGSRGKGVQPRSLEVFDDLGIGETVLAHGRLAMPMHSTGPDGQLRRGGDVPASLRDRPDIPYPASLITPQWRVEQALRERLTELGGTVEFGAALVGFAQTAESVAVTLEKNGIVETIAASWLVGCDGGHSVVRKSAGIGFEGETREEVRMLVADVRVDGLDRDSWHMWRHADGVVSLCPLPSTDLFQFQASIAPGQDGALERANLQEILRQRSGRDDIRIGQPEWVTLWRANVRLADRYRQGRVFLAGDAAHVHSPAGGQGMNTGIQDAANLGWKLAEVMRGAHPRLLDSYEAERRPVAAGVLGLSDQRLKQALEQKGMSTRRDASTIQLDVGYRQSALAVDDRDDDARLRAGDRAPDATGLTTVDGRHRLFELTRGGRFTLLSFGTAPDVANARVEVDVLEVVAQPTGPGQVADAAGHLTDVYQPTARSLVLIRPDGYIGVLSDAGDPAAIAEYLSALG